MTTNSTPAVHETQGPATDRLQAALRTDTAAQYDTDADRVAAVLAAADKADAAHGVHRITEDGVFDALWGRQYPTGARKWAYLDANAARAIAKRVVATAAETDGDR